MNAPTALIPLVEANPVIVLTDSEKFNRFYAEMKRETDAHVPDLKTATGRKAIAALAYKVARTKTAIDDAGKKLNEEARASIAKVDEARRDIRERLDALKDEVRKPLTEWEAAEEKRTADCNAVIERIRGDQVVSLDDTAAGVSARADAVAAIVITEDQFAELHPVATQLRDNAVRTLEAAAARLTQEEADRAELERLRAESAARQEREAAERAAADARARAEAEAAEAARREEAAAVAEKARLEAAEKAAEERARLDAERKAAEEREAADRAHAEALAAERKRADDAEAARKAEAEQAARAQAEREAAERQEAEQRTRREADIQHRGRIMAEAKAAIMSHGIGETAAKAVVLAIKAGEVPHVSITF